MTSTAIDFPNNRSQLDPTLNNPPFTNIPLENGDVFIAAGSSYTWAQDTGETYGRWKNEDPGATGDGRYVRLQDDGGTQVINGGGILSINDNIFLNGSTGDINPSGTVDGRDVAADGTKLDGIETDATRDQTAAEIRTLVEAATDSNVFTDSDHTKLDGIEAGATVSQWSDVSGGISYADGNVGIGTTSPQAQLHLATGSNGRILFNTADASNGYDTRIETTDEGLEFTARSSVRGFRFNTGQSINGVFTEVPRVVIEPTGNVGIGTTNPAGFAGDCQLAVSGSGGARIGVSGRDRTFYLEGRTDIDGFTIGARGTNNTVDVPKVTMLTAGGITFGYDTSTANALDDYEEGTFTPAPRMADAYLGGTRNPTVGTAQHTGRYTKVGNIVYVQVFSNFNASGITPQANDRVIYDGLPFAPRAGNGVRAAGTTLLYKGIGTGANAFGSGIVAADSTIDFIIQDVLGTGVNYNSYLTINCVYETT